METPVRVTTIAAARGGEIPGHLLDLAARDVAS